MESKLRVEYVKSRQMFDRKKKGVQAHQLDRGWVYQLVDVVLLSSRFGYHNKPNLPSL